MKLLCGDVLDMLKTLPDKSVDIVFTSPPFKDDDVAGDYWKFYDAFFLEAIRITSKVTVIIHSATKLNYLMANYPPKRLMIWGKGIIAASYRFNPILVYQISDDYKVNKYIWSDTIGVMPINGKNKSHPYEDPVLLYETVLKMFKGCNTVIDPFVGSGTTAEACHNLGLSFTGIDLNPEYIKMSQKRIDKVLYQPKLPVEL